LSTGEEIICQSCGASVPKGRFCPKCGTILGASDLDEAKDRLNRLQEIKKLVDDLRVKSLDKISIESEKILLSFREEFLVLLKQAENKVETLSKNQPADDKKKQKTDSNRINCSNCGANVPNVRFCKECGSALHASPMAEIDDTLNRVNRLIQLFGQFQTMTKTELPDDLVETVGAITTLLQQIKNRLIAKRNIIVKTTPTVRPTPAVAVQPTPTPVGVEPMRVELEEKPKSAWSGIEKSLLNYWFFYLAIILFSIGITLTIYYVSIEVSVKSTRVIIIYSIGGGIVLLGEIASILTRWRRKKQDLQEADVEYKSGDTIDKEKNQKSQERRLPIPQLANVIIFIGFIVLFTGGFFGYADISMTAFLFVSYGVALLAIVLGIVNNSNLLVFIGFNAAIIFTAADVLWHSTIVLGSIGSLFGFIVPIILAGIVAIFFKKWWGALITMSVTPFMILIPEVYRSVGLEFIPIILIPIMILLVVRYSDDSIPLQFRRGLVFLSLIIPSICLIVLSFSNDASEAAWGRIYPWEVFLTCLTFLGVSFSYRFIQEKYLEFKQSNFTIWILGQIVVGMISVFSIAFDFNTVTTSLYFASFFVFGILSVLKAFGKHFNIATAIISFVFAELQSILLLTIANPVAVLDQILYFILAIAFTILALVTVFISMLFINSDALFVTWTIISTINIILLGLLGKLPNDWYGFVGIVLLLVTTLVVSIPYLIPQITNWRVYSLIANLSTGIVIFSFLMGDKLATFPYEGLVIFLVFLVMCVSPFINWKQKEVAIIE